MDLVSQVNASITGTSTKPGDLGITPTTSVAESISMTLADGVGASQSDLIVTLQNTIIASGDDDIDLSGSLSDYYGDSVVLAKIKAIFIKNTSDTQSSVTAAQIQVGGGTGGDGTNAFDTWVTSTAADGSEAVIIDAGGFIMVGNSTAAGYAVTAGTADILHINNNTAEQARYDLVIIGTTA